MDKAGLSEQVWWIEDTACELSVEQRYSVALLTSSEENVSM